jgi:hypothetical protein
MRTYTNEQLADEELVAYADGELPAEQAHAIAQAAAADAALARRIERFAQTRRVLGAAFATKLAEPVPQRLLDVLSAPTGKVAPLRRATAARAWVPMALAASVALAVGLSVSLWLPGERGAGVAIAGLPGDASVLAEVLERSGSGEPRELARDGGIYEILPTATLQTAAGWCREFESRFERAGASARARAVACRQHDGAWRLVAAAAADGAAAPGGDYAPASGAGPDLAAGLAGAVRVTPAQEAALIRDNWQQPAPR